MKVQHQWNITEVNPQLVREKKNLSIYYFIHYRFHVVWAERKKTRISAGEGQN